MDERRVAPAGAIPGGLRRRVAAAASVLGSGGGAPVEVLLDVGAAGGRTGVRSLAEGVALADLVHATPELRLVGVSGYEGVAPNNRSRDNLAAVDRHCELVRGIFLAVSSRFSTDRPHISMGGSAFPDRAVDAMPDAGDVPGVERSIRSGCYVTHDHGTYAGVSPFPGLRAALTVRTNVLSAHEGEVVLGAGKRDLPYDAGLPVVVRAWSPDGDPRKRAAGRIRTLFDHHAVVESVDGLSIGDIVDLGISHPCSAFDRWPEYLAVSGDGTTDETREIWRTSFHRPSLADAFDAPAVAPAL